LFPHADLRDSASVWLAVLLIALPIIIPALVYRWSIKMTALIWSPLVWAFRPLAQNENIMVFARKVVDLSIYKVGRIYSGIVVVASIFKVIIPKLTKADS
jgi:hypothetical protein